MPKISTRWYMRKSSYTAGYHRISQDAAEYHRIPQDANFLNVSEIAMDNAGFRL